MISEVTQYVIGYDCLSFGGKNCWSAESDYMRGTVISEVTECGMVLVTEAGRKFETDSAMCMEGMRLGLGMKG